MNKRMAITAILAMSFASALIARTQETWSFQEMFDKSDLVVIGRFAASKDTGERTNLPGYGTGLIVVGVVSDFESCIVLKGQKDTTKFQLHHYRYEKPADEFATSNMPELIKLQSGVHGTFLMFLIKQPDGKYAPVTGQTDPASDSVLALDTGIN
jgi:hypothetical protein